MLKMFTIIKEYVVCTTSVVTIRQKWRQYLKVFKNNLAFLITFTSASPSLYFLTVIFHNYSFLWGCLSAIVDFTTFYRGNCELHINLRGYVLYTRSFLVKGKDGWVFFWKSRLTGCPSSSPDYISPFAFQYQLLHSHHLNCYVMSLQRIIQTQRL